MKAVLISRNDQLHNEMAALCASRSPTLALVSVRGGLAQSYEAMAEQAPQIVIFDGSGTEGGALVALENLSTQYPQAALMLLTPDQSTETLLRAMRAGVREVVPLPLDWTTLGSALNRIMQKFEAAAKPGKVLSFISCKGGSGATFIAANFGYALAAQANQRVLLIDLNRQFGDAVLHLSDRIPTMTLADVCAQIGRLDRDFLESSLVNVTPRFGILAACTDPARSGDITPERIDTLLALARNCYDYVILDVGRQIDAVSIHALDHSDLILPVLQMSMPYVRDASRLLEIFRSLDYPKEKIRILVNRYDKGGELHLSDLRKTFVGIEMLTIPNNFRIANASVNQGVPLLELARGSSIAKSLSAMVERMTERGTASNEKSFLTRLFGARLQSGIASA